MTDANDQVVSKSVFADIAGVSRVRVSQYLAERKISGDALVGTGRKAKIRVAVAMAQLKRNLDVSQSLGANGKVKANAAADPEADTIEDGIKRARLEQLELANEQARALREVQAGRYARSDDVRQELGRVAGRMLGLFEGSLGEFATAVAAKSDLSGRDALHILRTAFRGIRERVANTEAGIAKALPPSVDDEARL
jgi:hypothetical protein